MSDQENDDSSGAAALPLELSLGSRRTKPKAPLASTFAIFWLALPAPIPAFAQATNLDLNPIADSFLRADAPRDNYGRAGSLAVAGASATNGFGLPSGRFDSLLRFSLTDAVRSLDATFGSHNWFITRAALQLNEVAAPANAIFPRGVIGAFKIRGAAAFWAEGTGSPSLPAQDGVAYQDLPSLFDPQTDMSLGSFTNSGLDGPVRFELSPVSSFMNVIEAPQFDGEITLHLLPQSEALGFVFNSRNFATDGARPRLELNVVGGPRPRIEPIELSSDGEVTIRFSTRSNWTYVLQTCDTLTNQPSVTWTNFFTAPAQPVNSEAEVRDAGTNAARFYRLSIAPN